MWSDFLSIQRSPATQNLKKASAQSSQGQFRTSGAASATFGRQMLELQETVTQYANRRSQDVVQIQARVPGNQYAANPPESPSSSGVSASTEAKLAELREIAKNADYTGMSYGEISAAIWNRYNDAFDGNLGAFSIAGDEEMCIINNQYVEEIRLYVETPLKEELANELGFTQEENRAEFQKYFRPRLDEINREKLGYDGMTDDETEAAILEKYKGKDSILDFLNMQAELRITGVLRNKMGEEAYGQYYGTLCRQVDQTYFPQNYIDRIPLVPGEKYNVFQQKFDPDFFFSEMKSAVQQSTFRYFSYDVKGVLLKSIDLAWSICKPSTVI